MKKLHFEVEQSYNGQQAIEMLLNRK